jgi:uncharacterized protein YndB with AHSA1/START domain
MIDDEGTIHHEVRLAHPVERVWHAITDRDEIGKWLMTNDFTPEVGHHFKLETGNEIGAFEAEVLTVDEPRMLRCRWMVDGTPTTVTMVLEPDGDGTRLRLEHAGAPAGPREGFDEGWPEKFDNLARVLKEET